MIRRVSEPVSTASFEPLEIEADVVIRRHADLLRLVRPRLRPSVGDPHESGYCLTSMVEVDGTVRRSPGPHTAAVHSLLRHLEAVGFEGAPRVLGFDEHGREVLAFLDGEVAAKPLQDFACGTDALVEVADLLRRYHEAAASFVPPAHAVWSSWLGAGTGDEVICHNDLYPGNVVFRDGRPVGLIDWEFAAPSARLFDVANAVKHWVPLKSAEHRARWGWRDERLGPRLRLFCDAYGLSRHERHALLDAVQRRSRIGYESLETSAQAGVPRFAEMWREGGGDQIREDMRWLASHRSSLQRFLR